MLYYRKKRSKKKHYIRLLIIILIILVSLISSKANTYTSKFVSIITTPFAQASNFISDGFNSIIEATIGSKANREMVEKLTKENQKLQKDVNDLSFIVNNKSYLEESYKFASKMDSLRANVILLNNDSLYSEIIIDKGTLQGVEEGDIVLNPYTNDSKNIVGALIGKVIEAGPTSSTVSTILDEKYNISFVHSKSGQTGVINNREGLILSGYLLEKTDIKKNDLIYTSGVGGRYPRGVYMGKVEEVGQTKDKLSQIIKISSPVDFSKLYEVYVVKTSQVEDGVSK